MGFVISLALGFLSLIGKAFKSIFGMSTPTKTLVQHAKPEVQIDGKTNEERLKDLGL